jgi:hypothetical protein
VSKSVDCYTYRLFYFFYAPLAPLVDLTRRL